MRRRLTWVAVAMVVIVGLAVLGYQRYRIPPQGSGDGWRVLGQVEAGGAPDAVVLIRDVAVLLPDGPDLAAASTAMIVPTTGGPCDKIRVTDVELTDAVIDVDIARYRGLSNDAGCGDSIALQHHVVIEVPTERVAAVITAVVDGRELPIERRP